MIHPSARLYVTARRRPFTVAWLRRMGALFYAPFDTEHGSTVWSKGKGWVTQPSTEAADADGFFVAKRSGILVPARANVLRIERLGALLEGAETNNVGANDFRDFTTANWTESDLTADNDSVVMPDGTTRTTNTLTATAADGTLINDLGVIASAAKVFSLWIRRKTGSGDIQLTLDNGANWETVSVNDDWTRFTTTRTVANPDVGIRIVTDEDAVFVDFAQHENIRSYATSNIVGGAVRSADVLRFSNVGEEHAKAARGTFLCLYTPKWSQGENAAVVRVMSLGSTTDGVLFSYATGGSALYRYEIFSGGSGTGSPATNTAAVKGTPVVIGGTWGRDLFDFYINGVPVSRDTSGAAPTAGSQWIDADAINFGGLGSGAAVSEGQNIKDALFFDRSLNPGEIGQVSREIEIRTQNQ